MEENGEELWRALRTRLVDGGAMHRYRLSLVGSRETVEVWWAVEQE